jgi:hypothetical protein
MEALAYHFPRSYKITRITATQHAPTYAYRMLSVSRVTFRIIGTLDPCGEPKSVAGVRNAIPDGRGDSRPRGRQIRKIFGPPNVPTRVWLKRVGTRSISKLIPEIVRAEPLEEVGWSNQPAGPKMRDDDIKAARPG